MNNKPNRRGPKTSTIALAIVFILAVMVISTLISTTKRQPDLTYQIYLLDGYHVSAIDDGLTRHVTAVSPDITLHATIDHVNEKTVGTVWDNRTEAILLTITGEKKSLTSKMLIGPDDPRYNSVAIQTSICLERVGRKPDIAISNNGKKVTYLNQIPIPPPPVGLIK